MRKAVKERLAAMAGRYGGELSSPAKKKEAKPKASPRKTPHAEEPKPEPAPSRGMRFIR